MWIQYRKYEKSGHLPLYKNKATGIENRNN